ncbi:guanylate kinase [Clathrospora elynae]|uniref:Guanylate kinase n=1 Tax=Clathrospora elynae TaxID=706981 RepID=A0A6A5SD70_9PLEO|nr:guanylate kinase [Clathrospora elynae]
MSLLLSRLSRNLLKESRSGVLRIRTHPSLPQLTSTTRSPKSAYSPPPTRTFTHPSCTLRIKMAPLDPVPADKAALHAHTPIVISGPSGAGKSTILKRLFDDYPNKFGFSISHTTRGPRGSEKDGVEYYFVSKEEFLALVDKKGFVEHAQFGGNHYGTSVKAVNDIAEKGQICILDIEMEGVKQVANHPTFPRPRFLFLQPPSMGILEKRLRSRATDKEEAIVKRLHQAQVEMDFAHSGQAPHDKIVVNDDLDKAYKEVKEFIVGDEA